MVKNVILRLEDVSYRYQDAKQDDFVLKNMNYEFELGKIYAIKGKSGSGKTTLLSLLSGLEVCTSGNIYYEGKSLTDIDLDHYRNTYIGIVFQSYNLLPHLTASENIILSMDISHIKNIDKRKRALELMEKVGLSKEYENRKILKLSGGEQQRIGIARALSHHPDVIIADEPTGNLDGNTEENIMNILQDLAHKENKCVIIVTHSKSVSSYADELWGLNQGNLVFVK